MTGTPPIDIRGAHDLVTLIDAARMEVDRRQREEVERVNGDIHASHAYWELRALSRDLSRAIFNAERIERTMARG